MEKKVYEIPYVEVLVVNTELMKIGGEGSPPPYVGAPKRPATPTNPVMPLDSVAVF